MSLSLLSPGLDVVPKLRVICDMSAISDVVLESVPFHICDVVVESVPFHILVHIHTRLADVVVHNVTSCLSSFIVDRMSRFPSIVVS